MHIMGFRAATGAVTVVVEEGFVVGVGDGERGVDDDGDGAGEAEFVIAYMSVSLPAIDFASHKGEKQGWRWSTLR